LKKAPLTAVLTLLGALIILAIWITVSFFSSGTKKNYMTEYNEMVGTLSMVDSLMIGYHETGRINITLDTPTAIHIDADNRLFIASGTNICELDSSGLVTRTIPVESMITSLVTGDDGRIYSTGKQQIVVIDTQGTKRTVWKIGEENTYLTSIAVDGEHIFTADAGMKTLWHLDKNGKVIGRIADRDSVRGIDGLIIPSPYIDLAIGQGGSVWVANTGRHRIENYRHNGDLVSYWGEAGTFLQGFCGCCNPAFFALLPDGRFVTSEKGILRVKVYDQAGNFESVVAASFKGESPVNIAVDSYGTIFILDNYEKAIRQFKKNN
jgi:DNA-binding beta-propeller fold protein YncE